jgi:hypothetical protein
MLLALQALAGQDRGGKSASLRLGDAGSLRAVADDDGDLRRELAAGDTVGDGHEVGAASGEKYAESNHPLSAYSAGRVGLKDGKEKKRE